MFRLLLGYFLLISSINGSGQDLGPVINLDAPRQVNLSLQLPPNLLNQKSCVLIKVHHDNPNDRRNWQQLGEEVHNTFRKIGIDAVYYYYLDDIISGPEVKKAFSQNLVKRQVSNLIFINVYYNLSPNVYQTQITTFNGETSLVNHYQDAWMRRDTVISKTMLELTRASTVLGNRSNFLIADTPEFYEDIVLYRSKRFEQYPINLRTLKMGVVRFKEFPITEGLKKGLVNYLTVLNLQSVGRNQEMESILAQYPFRYELVDQEETENQLRSKNISYVLYLIHTKGEIIRKMLNYHDNTGESAFLTHVKSNGDDHVEAIPRHMPVYKFYLKHLPTGDVYLGSRWEADQRWQDALENFLKNMQADL